MKQVIYIWNYKEWDGAQVYFFSIVKNASCDQRFTIILPRDSKPETIAFFEKRSVELGFIDKIIELAAQNFLAKIARQRRRLADRAGVYRELLKHSLKEGLNHIEVVVWQSRILLYLLSLQTHVFVTMHNGLPENVAGWRKKLWSRRLDFILSRKKFHLFAANQNAGDSLRKFIRRDLWNKPVLTRASIDAAEIEKINGFKIEREFLRRKFELPPEKFLVLCVGQFIPDRD